LKERIKCSFDDSVCGGGGDDGAGVGSDGGVGGVDLGL